MPDLGAMLILHVNDHLMVFEEYEDTDKDINLCEVRPTDLRQAQQARQQSDLPRIRFLPIELPNKGMSPLMQTSYLYLELDIINLQVPDFSLPISQIWKLRVVTAPSRPRSRTGVALEQRPTNTPPPSPEYHWDKMELYLYDVSNLLNLTRMVARVLVIVSLVLFALACGGAPIPSGVMSVRNC